MPVWMSLRHNGVVFPENYVPKGLSIAVKGIKLDLSPLAEEMAYHLAKKKDTPYVQDFIFTANFMKDFRQQLPDWAKSATFADIDFSPMYSLVDEEKRRKESTSKEERKLQAASRKETREGLKARYGKATIDGKEVEIANWMVEPPGLFMGRGAHPLRGSWKPRVEASDITLNLDESAAVPEGAWGSVVHDHESIWIARWIDKLTKKEKYVWPHESSDIQQSRNKEKYDKALRIGSQLGRLRRTMLKVMALKDDRQSKVATVCYLIDRIGMRVGDEKDEDEADTVGATTLRVEHAKVGEKNVEFDFLGKDSVRWIKTLENPDELLLKNLKKFTAGKNPGDQIFDGVNSAMVNRFLSSIIAGLTAKVFRTYHATLTTELYLKSKDVTQADETEKIYHAKMANLEAARFCNHKRTPPKTWDESMKKRNDKLEEYKTKGKQEQVRKMTLNIELALQTREYNLNTSLKNYIDPRMYKSWSDHVGLDWTKLYTTSLHRKFSWVAGSRRQWSADHQEQQQQPAVVGVEQTQQ